jgi:hypothetical protein
LDDRTCVIARTFRIAAPFVLDTPIAQAERGCRGYFYQIEIECFLEGCGCGCQTIGGLIINWKMPPQGNGNAVELGL